MQDIEYRRDVEWGKVTVKELQLGVHLVPDPRTEDGYRKPVVPENR